MRGRVLVIAGSDSGGGAGIQADIKTITALGAYAATAITALTAQDTLGVHGILPVPPEFVRLQAEAALADLGADAIKTGMLGSAAVVETVAGLLADRAPGMPLVVDPVMVAKGGAQLLEPDAVSALKRSLLPLASLLMPNLPEAEALTGLAITTVDEMHHAAEALLTLGVPAVLLKGGHLPGTTVTDMLATVDGVTLLERPRIETRHTHGTGCTLASAVAAGLAQGMALRAAVERARAFVQAAITEAPGFGSGHGPLNHAVVGRPQPEVDDGRGGRAGGEARSIKGENKRTTGLASPRVLHPEWYREIIVLGVDPAQPGLYEWRIDGVGIYIGQYTHVSRPRREYGLNVGRLLAKHPYRKNKSDGFRTVHRELAKAVDAGRTITLTLLENQVVKIDRNRRERQLIAERRAEAERGGLPVLNSISQAVGS